MNRGKLIAFALVLGTATPALADQPDDRGNLGHTFCVREIQHGNWFLHTLSMGIYYLCGK